MDEKLSFNLNSGKIFNFIIYLIILLLFIPSEKFLFLLPFLILLIYLLKNGYSILTQIKYVLKKYTILKILLILFSYQFINYIVALAKHRADFFTFPLFIVSFWFPLFFVLAINKENYTALKKWLIFIILLQGVIILGNKIFVDKNFYPGDCARGTTISAHWIGFCYIWLIFYLIINHFKYAFLNLLFVVYCLSVLFLTDSKAEIVISVMIGIVLLGIILVRRSFRKLAPGILLFILIMGGVLLLSLSFNKIVKIKKEKFESLVSVAWKASSYVKNTYFLGKLSNTYITGKMNHKFLFVKRGIEYLLKNNLLLWGTSPGTLGSRASNLRACEVLYKPSGYAFEFLRPYASPATEEVYKNLYTREYHRSARFFINILALPFSSVFSFFFENGIIGFIILIFLIFYLIKVILAQPKKEALESLFLLGVVILYGLFDTIWERPFIMSIFYIILTCNFYLGKK